MPDKVTTNFPLLTFQSWRHLPNINYKNFIELQKDTYACASSVPSNAGGGNHGCLGQVMPEAEYLRLAGVPYVRTQFPNVQDIPQRMNNFEQYRVELERRRQQEQAERERDLEQALKRMIIQAVPERYLAVLRNRQTGAYEGHSVRQMLDHLRTTVAPLTYEEVEEEYNRIGATNFDPDGMEVTEVIAEVRDLGKLAETINVPFNEAQLTNLAIKVFTNCGHFTHGIRTWMALPTVERTLDNCHQHFMTEHTTLRRLHPQGIGAITGHHANALKEGDLEYWRTTTKELMEVVNALRQEQIDMRQDHNTMRQEYQEQTRLINSASSTTTTTTKAKKATKGKAKREEYQQEGNENNPYKYYCWIHGCNNTHPSSACRRGLNNKEEYPNFKPEATFTNRMGGWWKGSYGS